MKAHTQGHDVILVFDEDVGSALTKVCDHNTDSEAVILAKATTIVRRVVFQIKEEFNGLFNSQCQEHSVPKSLLALVNMVLNGPNINSQSSASTFQPALTLSQLLFFNSSEGMRYKDTESVRHNKQQETPLPIYLGMVIHTKTRKHELVDTLFNLGLCISYNRVLNIPSELCNKICCFYSREKVACPPQLKGGLFTTVAANNIDHNPFATSARGFVSWYRNFSFSTPKRGMQWHSNTWNCY